MKACVIQPPYSRDVSFSQEYFDYKMKLLDECDDSLDIIVLPEYSDVPCATRDREETLYYHKKYIDILLDKCIETAKRCDAVVFVNALCPYEGNYRNTTYAYNRKGELAGKYYKRHIPPVELAIGIDYEYTKEFSEPFILEIDGLKYGFLTCYDFYFYEAFPQLARQNPDIIIGCSLQRSDTHDALEIMCRFLAYNTNAYVIRSSVSFAEDSTVCGASMIVSPFGKVLANMQGRFGMATAEFDPYEKHLKPAGFGRADAPHHEYIEIGRNPWQYRPCGSSVVRNDADMPYPRVCAHRGFSAVLPENSMPAFGAAVAMGADEIEFDLWYTKDGEIVSIHDNTLERVSDGEGFVYDHTYEELLNFDFGSRCGDSFAGLKILKFEEILRKFAGQVIMNVHIKTVSDDCDYSEDLMRKMINLVDKYDCRKYVYFMITCDKLIELSKRLAPDIAVCCGERWDVVVNKLPTQIVDRAIKYGCEKVQLFHRSTTGIDHFTQADFDKAHAHGIRCNVFFADEPKEAIRYLEMGADTILTNEYNIISQTVKNYKKEKAVYGE